MSDHITKAQRGPVLHLGFNRPERKNSITAAMYQTLADSLNHAASDDGVRVVLIHGSEQMFSAGNDLEDFLKNPPHGDSSPVFQFLMAISAFPKPLVAAVAGVAVGVGVTMLMHCDLVYVADNAKLSVPFAQLGLCPEAASSYLLPMIAGYQKAAEKLLLGEPFGAQA
jgi:enoyl-CoA hydratase/carnithine racemase